MPKLEYAQIAEMKQRAAKLGRPTKKSEVLRAAVALLSALSDPHLLTALQAVPSIKTGRPKVEAAAAKPAPKPVAKKVAAKKTPAKKATAKKTVATKPAVKKASAPKASKA